MKYLSIIFIVLLIPLELIACKYSVRDVAFVNLNSHSYNLYFITNEKISENQSLELANLQQNYFSQSNVKFHVVSQSEFEDEIVLDGEGNFKNPRLVMIDQNGRHFTKTIHAKDSQLKKMLIGYLESPLREKLKSRFVQVHSTVLLLEGKTDKWNKRAEEIVNSSIEKITHSMSELPKAIPHPPVLVRLSQADQKKEKILLWSLGIEEPVSEEPRLVILYGKGRLLGSTFKVPGLTETELVHYLNYVGQDCECELDRSDISGIMIPLKWGIQLQTDAKEILGFNPENEFIKEEVTRILARGAKRSGKTLENRTFQSDPLLGYSEMNLKGEDELKTSKESKIFDKKNDRTPTRTDPLNVNHYDNRRQDDHWFKSFFITFMIVLMIYLGVRRTASS